MSTANPNIWTYREGLAGTVGAERDVTGYSVEAADGSIGKVDKASNEAGRGFLVVDTGFWIFGKKRMIPAGVVTRIDHDNRRIDVTMTKDQIKQAPDYRDELELYDDVHYNEVGTYYDLYGR